MSAERIYRDSLRRMSPALFLATYDRMRKLAWEFPGLEWAKVEEDWRTVAAERGIDLHRALRTELVLPKVEWLQED